MKTPKLLPTLMLAALIGCVGMGAGQSGLEPLLVPAASDSIQPDATDAPPDSASQPDSATTPPRPRPVPVRRPCCRICTTGKACGNSCISRSYTCRKPPGCACNGVGPVSVSSSCLAPFQIDPLMTDLDAPPTPREGRRPGKVRSRDGWSN